MTETKLDNKEEELKLQQQTVSLVCQRCGHSWQYKGHNPYVAICSYCKTTVQIRKQISLKKIGGGK
jgi:ribosomal protein L37E